MKRRWQKWLLGPLALVLVLAIGMTVFVRSGYRADPEAVNAFAQRVEHTPDGSMVCYPQGEYHTGLIFYPGGNVEAAAYLPLMAACAEKGILCVLVPMPLNLAVLNPNAAAAVPEQFPEVHRWYLGGHSLGGAMAAAFTADQDWLEGLVLLAAYSTEDVTHLKVLSVYGTEDTVLNQKNYVSNLANLPGDLQELVIQGGNHAGFGCYGPQKGDGTAAISPEEQIRQTAEAIASFLF